MKDERCLMATRVGFIGLGRMGRPMAANIIRAGFDLMVYDAREEPVRELALLGAKVASSPEELGRHAEIIELAVVDDAQVEAVVAGERGVLRGAGPGAIITIHSTIFPATAKRLAEIAGVKGVGVLDGPVSGGETGARDKALCYMVGGDKELVEKCRPIFATSASHIFYMGDTGAGAMTKLIIQVIVCMNMLAAYEGAILCEKTGLDFNSFREALRVSSGQSFVAENWHERFQRPGDPLPVRRQRAEIFSKSLSPALELALDLGISLPGAALAQRLLPRVMGVEEE